MNEKCIHGHRYHWREAMDFWICWTCGHIRFVTR